MLMPKIVVIIPALNEAGNIKRLVTEVLATTPAQVIVVDNGSTAVGAVVGKGAVRNIHGKEKANIPNCSTIPPPRDCG